ncbi:hypothetical protein F8M41_019626 [Gigaspora margarita]|uniref:Uncharacterized protein n=1 Tax=Gigaspora margarita TaxID=4874 RepID=A0A8H4AJS7_GIGMA|nr:hypothetical protein F8M41_019626 [Gigaspora margarita]
MTTQSTVTISDLKQTKPSGIPDVSKFCGATQASLSGQEGYESYKLSCRVSVSENSYGDGQFRVLPIHRFCIDSFSAIS